MRLIFDLETDGLLPDLTKIHCLSIRDVATGRVRTYTGHRVVDGLDVLSRADEIIAHNGIGFDVPAILKLHPDWEYSGKLVDTLCDSRLIWPHRRELDMGINARRTKRNQPLFPKKLYGLHSLEAWGHRFGLHKGDYAAEMKAAGLDPWAELNDDMVEYCEQDTAVTLRLLEHIERQGYSQQARDLEYATAWPLAAQMRFGCRFDTEAAAALQAELADERAQLDRRLRELFGSWYAKAGTVVPKRDNSRFGYVAGCEVTKVERKEFNPASRDHIANRLQKQFGWQPTEFTPSGKPKVDETMLDGLDFEGVDDIKRYLLVSKVLGQLSEGQNGWLKLVKSDDRIYHFVNQNGAVTGRATHSRPNLAQVPRVSSPFGKECRSLFMATPGWTFVGADASGLELHCLGHYMAKYDGGEYVERLLNGDIHSENQKDAGLPTRDNAKTFIYAFLYGAGNGKIGEIVGKGAQAGGKLRKRFLQSLPALDKLITLVKRKAKKLGYLKGLDGRKLHIRSDHKALNTLLQGAGAVIMKQAMVEFHRLAAARGLVHGEHYRQVLFVHDEFQCEALPEHADTVGQAMVDGIIEAGHVLNLRCPLDGEYKTGADWSETH